MIDLQAALMGAQMVSDAMVASAEPLRIDATVYVKEENYRMADIAIALAGFADAVICAKRLLEEELRQAGK